MKRRLLSVTMSLTLISALFVGLDLSFDIIPTVSSATTWYVDDVPGGSPPEDFTTIQDAVNASQPGDTVFVWNGTYYEDVDINKTLNLIGESRDNTIVNGSPSPTGWAIWGHNADYINISNFTVEDTGDGIGLTYSNYSLIQNVRSINNNIGIVISNCNGSMVKDNIASNNSDYHGIYLSKSTNITVTNNICEYNAVDGIYVYEKSKNNVIINNNFSNNYIGIHLATESDNNTIRNNSIFSNSQHGIFVYDSDNNQLIDNTLINNNKAIYIRWNSNYNDIINSTIKDSPTYDIGVSWNSNVKVLNTTFNRTKSYFNTIDTIITVRWYIHVNVIDYLGNPVPNAKIKIEDNKNGNYNETLITDVNGQIRWFQLTEYIEQDPDGNTIGEKIQYTPHNIIAWNNTLVGYAQPIMNESKTITIVLYNGTILDLEPGWNLVSLPRIQSDTDLQIILQSIEGHYDAVQWYNVSDTNDQWKHYQSSKPSNLNDLKGINHTIGFWLHITDPEGTTFVVIGNELISNQNISLHSGWNLVGYPSKTNKTRDIALGTINFGIDVDSIWMYNATTQKWVELDEATDYFEIGKGYWIHSKVTEVWNVPL